MFRDNNDPTVYFQLGLFLSLGYEHLYFSVESLATINSVGEGAAFMGRDEQKEVECEFKEILIMFPGTQYYEKSLMTVGAHASERPAVEQ